MESPPRTGFLLLIPLLGLGCARSGAYRTSEAPTGMRRVSVSRVEGGAIVRRETPITAARTALDEPAARRESEAAEPQEAEGAIRLAESAGEMRVQPFKGLEVRATRTRLWTTLTTDFQSASFNNLRWNPDPAIGGAGAELSYLIGIIDEEQLDGDLALRVGLFQGSKVTNFHQQGSVFVRETTQSEGYWADAGPRIVVWDWVVLRASLGGFAYHVNTDVETNAPSFGYSGIAGTRFFGAFGLGGGIQTPWRFPLKLSVEAGAWVPTAEEALFESAVGQASVGLLLRF